MAKHKEQAEGQSLSTVEDLLEAGQVPEYEDHTFTKPDGLPFVCRLKRFADIDEWEKLGIQTSNRMEQAGKPAGWQIKLEDGLSDTIKSPKVAAILTYLQFGMIEPKFTLQQLAGLRHKFGLLLAMIMSKIDEINTPQAAERAKNDSGQETGRETPELPASEFTEEV